ncbi:MAG TPA: MerR family transcriptional regulator [Kofleriaceae bacterium]|nr:MerR family transcriptional regulator [Kofleriaceae bacterium]
MDDGSLKNDRRMRVGELAKAVGKTVRAMHLYEELGLLEPRARSEGGFRQYGPEAIDRIHWIVKLQAIGFTLAEIQGFVRDFREASSAPEASARVRALFHEKQQQIREQITQLQVIENDLSEALSYLDSCQTCSTEYAPTECGDCDHQGHHKGDAPPLFAGLQTKKPDKDFDVPVTVLYREGNN